MIPGLHHPPHARLALVALGILGGALAPSGPASAFSWGNVVLTSGAEVREFRTDGLPVASIAVPYPPGARGGTNPLLGLAFDSDARLGVFNGATAPYLSVYDAGVAGWTHATFPGWSTLELGGFGGLAAFGHDFVAGDMATPSGAANGLIAFDGDAGYLAERGIAGFDFSDLAAGPDGRLHALVANTNVVFIFDPLTMASTGSVQLDGSLQAIALAPDGTYYGASGDGSIRRFTAQGASFDTLDTAIPGLIDVAVSASGEVAMSTALGEVVLCDAALSSAKTFLVGGGPAYITWVPFHPSTPAIRRSWGRLKDTYRR